MPRGVILGQKPAVPTILLPRDVAEEQFRCTICDVRFGRHEPLKYERHVGRCAARHIDEIRAAAPSNRYRGTFLDSHAPHRDPEVEEHMREVGKRMIREKRLEVLPHERAGF